jgi:hypothetical protein
MGPKGGDKFCEIFFFGDGLIDEAPELSAIPLAGFNRTFRVPPRMSVIWVNSQDLWYYSVKQEPFAPDKGTKVGPFGKTVLA